MRCPYCGHEGRGGVTAHAKNHAPCEVIRYRKCSGCSRSYRTREVIVESGRHQLPREPRDTLGDHAD